MSSTVLETVAVQPQHTLYVDVPACRAHMSSPSERLAIQLAHLASQHQKSEYNQFKFGPRGAPMTYSPMSMHSPELVDDLKARQATYSTAKSWWLSEKRPSKSLPEPLAGPRVIACVDVVDLQQELSAAIESPLSKNRPSNVQMKTSETHPINVSTIIPFEMLPIISSHLVKTQSWSPVLYDLPPSYYLDRVTTYREPLEPPPSLLKVIPPPVPHLFWNRGTVTQALQVAMTTGIRTPLKLRSLPISRTGSVPPRISTRLEASILAPDIEKITPRLPPTPPKSQKTHNLIGNLFLSSCPGKKVRLAGPVNGRVGVCRDLSRDLTRIKELGVGCVVCCLDDTELEYLGVSWSDYSRLAHEKGLDVLRVPTPEGLAPPSPEALNSSLDRLIESYTLQNIPILVHCRGGVGRAGLVACCWILKLGLCGWIETQPSPSISVDGIVRRDTLQLVERVISVVRRRRSVKAIETFEQVLFLVEFVEYLREHGLIPVESPKSLNDLKIDDDDDE